MAVRFVSAAWAARRRPCTASSSPTPAARATASSSRSSASISPARARRRSTLNTERANYWLDVGAQPTDTVRSLLRKAGVLKARHEARLAAKLQRLRGPRRRQTERGNTVTMSRPRSPSSGASASAHGIRGELVVELDDRRAGRDLRVRPSCFRGDRRRRPRPDTKTGRARRLSRPPPVQGRTARRFDEIADRTEAETWRGRYAARSADELEPPAEDEVYRARTARHARRARSAGPHRRRRARLLRAAAGPHARDAPRRARDGATCSFNEASCSDREPQARVIIVDAARGAARVKINIVTIFPEFFAGPLVAEHSRKARGGGQRRRTTSSTCATTRTTGTARWTTIRTAAVPGMVMKPEPFFEAVEALGATAPDRAAVAARASVFSQRRRRALRGRRRAHAALRPLQGRGPARGRSSRHRGAVARRLRAERRRTGRAGDRRCGGAPAARRDERSRQRARRLVLRSAVCRAPSYTRPPEFRGHTVPDVLLSGHHAKIAKWRKAEGERLTRERAGDGNGTRWREVWNEEEVEAKGRGTRGGTRAAR